MGKPLTSEIAARASVAQLAFQKELKYSRTTSGQKTFLIVDEAKGNKQKYITDNALVGSLGTPNEKFLIECLPLESSSNVNSSIILHTVDHLLRQLGTKREKFALF